MNDRRTEPQFDLGVTHEGDRVSSRATFSDHVTEKLVQTTILTETEMRNRSNKLSEPKRLKANVLLGAIIGTGFLASFGFPDTNTNREINAGSVAKPRPVIDAPDQFHCADYYYGSLPALQEAVKERLRDPDSYKHIRSRFFGVRPDGTQEIIMDYRARNGFGGYSIERALGKFENSTCMLIGWKVIE